MSQINSDTVDIEQQQERIRRNNIKCKRKITLVKKCAEIAQLCNLKIALVIFDPKKNEM